MSGNQYVYSVEIKHYGDRHGKLLVVKKSRKQARRAAARVISEYLKRYEIVHRDVVSDLTLTHDAYGDGAHCDVWLLQLQNQTPPAMATVQIAIRCWVIKKGKPEGPVRGTLRTKFVAADGSAPA